MERKMHLLVVDDEAAIRESLLEILEEEGYEVSCAESSAQARPFFCAESILCC
jgi:DNA-binding NtrC family response regulator